MADHGVIFELFYDGVWNAAPVISTRNSIKYMRGTDTSGGGTDPAKATATIDNRSGDYAPKSALSTLKGKIGQNTKGRLIVDSSVRMTGEVASWKPTRNQNGSDRTTPIELAGVLRRIGRGRDPLKAPLTRASIASGPADYWPLDDGKSASSGANAMAGGYPMVAVNGSPPIGWSGLDEGLVPGGMTTLPALNGGSLSATVRGTSSTSWRMEAVLGFEANSLGPTDQVISLTWVTSGGINTWWLEHGVDYLIIYARSNYILGLPFGGVVVGSSDPRFDDGRLHHVAIDVVQTTAVDMHYEIYLDGVLVNSGTNSTGTIIGRQQVGPPSSVVINPDNDTRMLTAGGIGFWSPHPTTPVDYDALNGYAGETAAARFSRLCDEYGITATVIGDPDETQTMGAQQTVTLLEQFDEVARTDDASIFETRDDIGLTMRTGVSKMNQTPVLTVSYVGQIQPTLDPVFGDEGIRNDVTATNPSGSSARVVQEDGPHNVQLPEDDPEGVGRYQTSVQVNTAADDALTDVAGWRVNLGTFNGTWYAEFTVDLDMAPSLIGAVNAVDIGDVIVLADLPAEEALDSVLCMVIGIEESLPPKRRLVTFHLMPADPYRVGVLANTTGDTDPLVGYLEPDDSTTHAAVSAGASSFQVDVSGPLWSTASDDFPQDVLVGGQRVSISAITGASSPQTFTVKPLGLQVVYPIAAGSTVVPYQPTVLVP